jgi:sugar lactone lactonase YvrE
VGDENVGSGRGAQCPFAVHVVDTGASHHGEGPIWSASEGVLHWVDLTGGVVHHLGAGDAWTFDRYDTEVTTVAPHAAGGLAAATSDGFAHLSDGALTHLSDILAETPTHRMNDGGVDIEGRLLAGSMAYDADPGAGTLYRLELDGGVSALLEGVTIPNGLDWSLDWATLYFTDSAAHTVTAYPYGRGIDLLGPPRVLLDLSQEAGEPDGLTVDRDGNLWIAMWDGWQVRCHAPDGRLLMELPLPVQRPTSVAFGGAYLTDLYITTSKFGLSAEQLRDQPAAGRLLHVQPTDRAGRPANLCRTDLTSPAS